MRNRKKDNVNRSKRVIAVLVMVGILLTVLTSVFYIQFIRRMTNENAYNNIQELSRQTASQLDLSIENQMKFVDIMIDFIDKGYADKIDDIFLRFKPDLESYHFTRLVVLDKDGNGITSDQHEVSNYPNISEFFERDEVCLSENRPSTVSSGQVNIYSKKFMFHDEERVLFATINTENYKEILSRRLFDGAGGTYLINNLGTVLIDSFDTILNTKMSLFEYLEKSVHGKKDLAKIKRMQINVTVGESGTFDVVLDKEKTYVHYERLAVNNWYVISVAKDETISKTSHVFLGVSLVLCFLINFVIIGILIYVYFSNQKKSKKLYEVAYIDSVTGLYNEFYFREKKDKLLDSLDNPIYFMVVDFNNLKKYKKMYDYEFCALIIKEFSDWIRNTLPSLSVTFKFSSDAIVSVFSYDSDIDKLLKRICFDDELILIRDREIRKDVSVGVYKYRPGDDMEEALDKAYLANSIIKGNYNEKYYVFDEALEETILEEEKIVACMEEALSKEEFKVIYQPKVSTTTEKLVGAEALVRWYHGDEIISPGKFIPIFEKNKFILKLDLYIFDKVCQDIVSFKKKYNRVPVISVNVSKENFVNENFIDDYVLIVQKYGLDAHDIELEITESAMVLEGTDIMSILANIKSYGFIVSIDDFGTGTSSLSLLQDIPIDIIKIDKTFIDNADLESNENLINYIEFIAKKLGIRTIVEGVESKKQVDFIVNLKCDMIQGYYYSKPLKVEEFSSKYLDKYKLD